MPASGKRYARRSSLHGVAARCFPELPLACLSAAAVPLGVPVLALIAGFGAVALVVDAVFPVTGFLRVDSQHAFQRLVWQRRREAFGRRRPWRHDHPCLELLPGRLDRSANRRHLVSRSSDPSAPRTSTPTSSKSSPPAQTLVGQPRWRDLGRGSPTALCTLSDVPDPCCGHPGCGATCGGHVDGRRFWSCWPSASRCRSFQARLRRPLATS